MKEREKESVDEREKEREIVRKSERDESVCVYDDRLRINSK